MRKPPTFFLTLHMKILFVVNMSTGQKLDRDHTFIWSELRFGDPSDSAQLYRPLDLQVEKLMTGERPPGDLLHRQVGAKQLNPVVIFRNTFDIPRMLICIFVPQ